MKSKKLAALFLAGALSVSMLSGCGLDKDAVVATMEDQEVNLGIANFLCRYQQAQVDDSYVAYFGEDVWSQDPYSSGTTNQESLKSNIMDTLHTLYTLQNHQKDYNVELTDEENAAIKEAAENFMKANTKEALDALGATQEIVEEVLTLYTIQAKMHEAIIAEADTEVSDEEANMRAYTMVRIATGGYYNSSYKYVEYTEEEVAEIKSNAEAMKEALKDNTDLEAVAKEKGFSATTGTYDADNSTLEEDVKTTLDGLAEGELSDMITTDTAIYFLRLDSETDEEATEENRQSIIEERQEALYTEVLEGWQEEDGWTINEKKLAKIQFKNLFTQEKGTETETEAGTEVKETVDGTEVGETADGTEVSE